MKYQVINENEDTKITREFIDKHYVSGFDCKNVNAGDCNIYMRGEYWIIEYQGDILYYESGKLPYFENAFHYMNVAKKEDWKTVAELTTFRQAIRESVAQGTDCCEMLEENITHEAYQEFLAEARYYDKRHHGQHTF